MNAREIAVSVKEFDLIVGETRLSPLVGSLQLIEELTDRVMIAGKIFVHWARRLRRLMCGKAVPPRRLYLMSEAAPRAAAEGARAPSNSLSLITSQTLFRRSLFSPPSE